MDYYVDAIELWKASKKKLRKEWKLGSLSNEQLAEVLRIQLNGSITYKALLDFIKKEFGLVIRSERSLSLFFSGAKHFVSEARRRSVMRGVGAKRKATAQEREQIDASNRQTLREVISEKLENPETSVEELTIFVKAFLELEKQEGQREQRAFDKEKFAVATCETFQKWLKDEKARAIADSNVSNQEKINQLRRHFFADIDALEKSGQVQLPR